MELTLVPHVQKPCKAAQCATTRPSASHASKATTSLPMEAAPPALARWKDAQPAKTEPSAWSATMDIT